MLSHPLFYGTSLSTFPNPAMSRYAPFNDASYMFNSAGHDVDPQDPIEALSIVSALNGYVSTQFTSTHDSNSHGAVMVRQSLLLSIAVCVSHEF